MKSEEHLELAHVLFMDVVGYSKLLLEEQREVLRELKTIVRATEEFRSAEASNQLVCLPTGDGMALAFFSTPEAPVRCAIEVARALEQNPVLQLRMGVHSGPVNRIADVNESANVAGAGINMAQRVMDCGDAGHILLSQRVAEDLAESREWKDRLHDLGECEVKHGVKLHLFNFFGEGFGNSATPVRLAAAARAQKAPTHKHVSRSLIFAFTGIVLLCLILFGWWWSEQRRSSAQSSAKVSPVEVSISDKSIAVLPFENLSDDKGNAYFVDGIQDEILTRLAKVADLKVISRTSTQRFRSKPENLPDIAKQLNVAHVLEGSVQRLADQVRVNVQLIKAVSDTHLWAETYDRKLTDVFVVETDIATKIADSLQAKLTGAEHIAMSAKPTEDMEAHELYLKGRYFASKRTGDDLLRAIDYYNQAISHDPNYALAYAALAQSYGLLPEYSKEPTDECFAKGNLAANRALALNSNLAEAHASMALMAAGEFKFEEARRGFLRAIELDPNSAAAHYFLGISVLTPLGEFEQAIAEIKRAVELDPLSIITNTNLGYCYYLARRYPEAIAQLRKTAELDPHFAMTHGILGLTLEATGDLDGAIVELEKANQIRREVPPLVFLARAYALKGDHQKSLQFVDQVRELEQGGSPWAYANAVIYLSLGDKDKAVDWLEESYRKKETGIIIYIKVDPVLDPLRGNLRFEALANKIIPPHLK